MRSLAFLTATVLLATVLAGCTDNDQPVLDEDGATDGLDLDATASTGVIRGVVIDAAIRPLAGVAITLPTDNGVLSTETNDQGAFGFQGLEPGTYFVKAEKLGYVTTQQSTDVVANVDRPDVVKILMEADPSTAPYIQSFQYKGFIECSFALVVVLFAACGVIPEDLSNNNFLAEWNLDGAPTWMQAEMVWESTQALGENLVMSFTCLDCGEGGTQRQYGRAEGPSPLLMVADIEAATEMESGTERNVTFRVFAEEMPGTDFIPEDQVHDIHNQTVGGCLKYPVLFDACLGAGGIGATIQQDFEAFNHVFYHFTPPEGWRFTNDGDPQVPT